MTPPPNATVGCLLVGDYVDEIECPPNLAVGRSEVVRPQMVASSTDDWGCADGLRQFTVLLKDGRVAAVRGHTLKHEPHPLPGEDVFSVIVSTETEEVLVALFKGAEVAGIFQGNLHTERQTA
ncbi:MAG: hypothetical protein SFV23_15625 [Planctomycetaceae bacterium]|nr:hypothetical protein [Planctomycetaceae bacterium]